MEWIYHLNNEGIIELLYIYSVIGQQKEQSDIMNSLYDYPIYRNRFNNVNEQGETTILSYRKK